MTSAMFGCKPLTAGLPCCTPVRSHQEPANLTLFAQADSRKRNVVPEPLGSKHVSIAFSATGCNNKVTKNKGSMTWRGRGAMSAAENVVLYSYSTISLWIFERVFQYESVFVRVHLNKSQYVYQCPCTSISIWVYLIMSLSQYECIPAWANVHTFTTCDNFSSRGWNKGQALDTLQTLPVITRSPAKFSRFTPWAPRQDPWAWRSDQVIIPKGNAVVLMGIQSLVQNFLR